MDEKANLQKETGDSIQRVITNYKKDGQGRKTLPYYQKLVANLDELWEKFESTDSTIRDEFPTELSHPYYTKNYYDSVKDIYQKYREEFQSNMGILKTTMEGHGKPPPQGSESKKDSSSQGNPPPEEFGSKAYQVSNPSSQIRDIRGLVRKQAIIIDSMQRVLNNSERSGESKQYYELQEKTIQRYWMQIEEIHNLIWEFMENPQIAGYDSNKFIGLEVKVQQALIKLAQQQQGSMFSNQASKLPTIELPKFDGNYSKWVQFRDLYVELVHNQPIPQCQKMWYLKTTLTGEAQKLIQHFSTSDANYSTAWETITSRYENIRLLVTTILNKLMNQPKLQNEGAEPIKALHDTTKECLLSLQNLGVNTQYWDPILLHQLIKNIDSNTHALWEQSLKNPRELPSIKEFLEFLELRFQSLEALGTNPKKSTDENRRRNKAVTTVTTTGQSCISCKGNHQLFACQKFLQLNPKDRFKLVQEQKHCTNCLKPGHRRSNCTSRGCSKCHKKHNTLLHFDAGQKTKDLETVSSTIAVDSTTPCTSAATNGEQHVTVILGTALINVKGQNGKNITCRALLDSGSQVNLISDKMAKSLGLKDIHETLYVEGIGQGKQASHRRINCEISSRTNGFTSRLEMHVLQKLIAPQPSRPISATSWNIPNNIVLADPQFNRPAPIDILIGAELFYSVLVVGQISLGKDLPTLQNTNFGWVVAGKFSSPSYDSMASCGICTADETLNQQIERFWRIEEPGAVKDNFTEGERRCETHFHQTTTRDDSGRFVVRLPFKEGPERLGESKDIAFRRFIALERRLANSPDLKQQYRKFMEEYQQLGHMEEVNIRQISRPYYFLPHHCVQKPDSSTTKLRVVFDASAKTSSNLSLNDILYTGPTLQDDVFTMLLRFRLPRYVFTADIEKMYRQVLVNDEDQKYQLIWWRPSSNDTLKCFKLKTVTYGTSSASYLATKCLQTLAQENKKQYPLGSAALNRDFYVDDVLTGSDKITEVIATQHELQTILQANGFKLRKWCANHASLLKNIPLEDRETELDFSSNIDEHIKTVGLTWMPKSDQLCVKTTWVSKTRITKRTAYSDIAHLFDPLGIMAPVIEIAKIFLQKLWELKLDWDAALPQEMNTTWHKYRDGLQALNNIKIDRHIFAHKHYKNVQYHVFADASEKAYGAAAYVRAVSDDNIITVRLLCSKSRVTPSRMTKQQATIPRHELCAADLATDLLLRLQKDLDIEIHSTFLWTDSQIVLAWINSTSSATLPVFVANRVSRIQRSTISQQWNYVLSKENPADVLSRGIAPERLNDCHIWFYGPKFLHGPVSTWPPKYKAPVETHLSITTITKDQSLHTEDILNRINHRNSFKTAVRIIAYVLRYINNSKQKILLSKISGDEKESKTQVRKTYPTQGPLTVSELDDSKKRIFKLMQKTKFKNEVAILEKSEELPRNNQFSSLTPFLDDQGLIRVGGRLEASSLPYDAKHPILIPYDHDFSKMFLTSVHENNNHVGPQTMLSITRQTVWPIT